MSKLLNAGNYKTRKGEKYGWKTYGLHLAPFNLSGKNVCSSATAGCSAACLNTAGRGIMHSVQAARIKKTRGFFEDRDGFLSQLYKEIQSSAKSATRKELKSCFRLNLTSDLEWETIENGQGQTLMNQFPNVQFYDYTKSFGRMAKFLNGGLPSNYHLTFSRSEHNQKLVEMVLEMGGNVAVVFRDQLPKTWKGFEVINGDENDLRFLDKQGVVVGLIEKGMAKKDKTGFVQEGINS